MIFKIAIYQIILFTCFGYMHIREQKRQEQLDAMLNEWLKKNVGKSDIKLRVIC